MRHLCYLGILWEWFSPYSSLVMLISQKMTQDKRMVTDFRCLNVRIAKNNLAYPLVRDSFSVLGNSKCEALSVLDFKDAFHSLRLLEDLKRYCGILPYFGSASHISGNAYRIEHFTFNLAIIYKCNLRAFAK